MQTVRFTDAQQLFGMRVTVISALLNTYNSQPMKILSEGQRSAWGGQEVVLMVPRAQCVELFKPTALALS